MNLPLSGSEEGEATAGIERREMQEKKKALHSNRGLLSCFSNQSLLFRVPGMWQSSFFMFFFFFPLIGSGVSETTVHR